MTIPSKKWFQQTTPKCTRSYELLEKANTFLDQYQNSTPKVGVALFNTTVNTAVVRNMLLNPSRVSNVLNFRMSYFIEFCKVYCSVRIVFLITNISFIVASRKNARRGSMPQIQNDRAFECLVFWHCSKRSGSGPGSNGKSNCRRGSHYRYVIFYVVNSCLCCLYI